MRKIHHPSIRLPMVALLAFLMLVYTAGCSYYRSILTDPEKLVTKYGGAYDGYKKIPRKFFVHQGEVTAQFEDVTFTSQKIRGVILHDSVSTKPIAKNIRMQRNGRIKSGMKDMVTEAHIYLYREYGQLHPGPVEFGNNEIESIYVIKRDGLKSFLIVIGVTTGVLAVFTLIALLTKSSCPYVYVHNGEDFVFEGEIFSGAVLRNLERHDYMPLPNARKTQNTYQVRIANELHERQYINLAELVVVHHPPGSQVLFDQDGNPVYSEKEMPPMAATSGNGDNHLPNILDRDSSLFSFNDLDLEKQHLDLVFDKPNGPSKAVLKLTGRNTAWGDHIFGEFAKKFGKRFNKWQKIQERLSYEDRMEKVHLTEMPLSIFLKKNNQWEMVDFIYMVGPLGEREMAVPIDLSDHDEGKIEIRLATGFNFWELNHVAMDFSPQKHIEISTIKPEIISTKQNHSGNKLLADDDAYYIQRNIGDQIELRFQTGDTPNGMEESVFLHCKGYYEHIRHFKGKPDIAELEKFRQPGYFSAFSKMEYLKEIKVLQDSLLTD